MSNWLGGYGGIGGDGGRRGEGVDAMQVCENGHKITDASIQRPEQARAFCPDCGSPTLISCPSCKAQIPGHDWSNAVVFLSGEAVPRHCTACGKPFPWTAKAMEAAYELIADADALSADEKEKLKGAMTDITVAGPRTELGVARVKALTTKAGGAIGSAIYKVAIDVASDVAKKAIEGR